MCILTSQFLLESNKICLNMKVFFLPEFGELGIMLHFFRSQSKFAGLKQLVCQHQMPEKYFLYVLLFGYLCAPADVYDIVFDYDLLSYILIRASCFISVLSDFD